MNTLIKNIEIMQHDTCITTNIVIKDNLIAHIGTDIPQDITFDKTIDGSNKFAAPGFVNAHTHAAMTLFRSYADDMFLMDWLQNKIWPAEAKLNSEDIYWGSTLAIAEMIKTGTTCFADMYFFMDQTAKAVEETGIRASLARGLVGVTPDAYDKLTENINFCKEWQGKANGRITTMFGPHAPYTCPPEYLLKVVEEAHKLGVELHMHLSETKDEVDTCIEKFGMTPIAHVDKLGLLDCGMLAAHCVHVTAEDIQIMQAKKVRVAHNPQSNLKLASGIAPAQAMLDAGLIVALGTDGATSNNNLDMLEEVRLAATLHKVRENNPKVIPAATALQMGTEFGAKALGLNNLGRIEVGYKADIVLYDMRNTTWAPKHDRTSLLVYAANSTDAHTVIVDGKTLMENYQLTTIDLEKAMFEVCKRGQRLVQ